jgi:hypothetical protein
VLAEFAENMIAGRLAQRALSDLNGVRRDDGVESKRLLKIVHEIGPSAAGLLLQLTVDRW